MVGIIILPYPRLAAIESCVKSARFIQVDERMRAADGILAMGDVTGKAMFTHMATPGQMKEVTFGALDSARVSNRFSKPF